MDIFFDKTIEQMATEGYKPVLGPGIVEMMNSVAADPDKPEHREVIEKGCLELLKAYKQSYPDNLHVHEIAAFVIRTGLTDGKSTIDLKVVDTLFRNEKGIYPVLPYIR